MMPGKGDFFVREICWTRAESVVSRFHCFFCRRASRTAGSGGDVGVGVFGKFEEGVGGVLVLLEGGGGFGGEVAV